MPPACPPHLRAAFLDQPQYVALPRGERLYKFVSVPIVRDRILMSPWWIRQPAFDVGNGKSLITEGRAADLQSPAEIRLGRRLAIRCRVERGQVDQCGGNRRVVFAKRRAHDVDRMP